MATAHKVQIQWNGLKGLPGLSTFYVDSAALPDLTKFKAFFTSMAPSFPPGLIWSFPSSGITVDESGGPVGVWTQPTTTDQAATGSTSAYAAPAGFVINWLTATYQRHRNVKGRTFMVPCLASNFQGDGTIVDGSLVGWRTAANTLVTGQDIRVWASPKDAQPGKGLEATPGAFVDITGSSIPDKVAVLTRRRD